MGRVELSVSDDDSMEMEMDLDLDLEEEDRRKRKKAKIEAVEVEIDDVHRTEVDGSSRVLSKMVLRVLLVEADDSTRRIIAALLRKCGYRVSAVPDGLKAWETLKGRPHNVDLILTEVDLPSISGYALLTLVMEHDICKNIPVIMMSSHDTVSMVLKCMLKGAADFLIKPIRKNELKNLWQHVWRRHTIGGKISMNLTGGQHKVEVPSDNDVTSNHSSDYVTSGKKMKEYSGKGSDAQSSCTTPYLEAESGCMPNMQGLSPLKDGTSPNLNMDIKKHGFTAYMDKEFNTLESNIKEKSDNAVTNVPCDSMSSIMKDHSFAEIRNQNVVVRPESYRVNADITCEINGYNNNESTEPSSGVIDLIGKFDDNQKNIERVSSYIDTGTMRVACSPQLELSLRRNCSGKSKNLGDEKAHALNHSNASAFSSYNSCKMMNPPPLTLSNVPTKSETSVSESLRPLPSLQSENSGCTSRQHGVPASNSQNNLNATVAGEFDQAEHQVQQAQLGLLPVPDLIFDKAYAAHVFPSVFYTASGLPKILSTRSTCQQEQSPITTNASFQNCYDISNSRQVYHLYEETTNHTILAEELKHDSPSATHSASSSLCNGTDQINSDTYASMCRQTEGNTLSPVAVEKAAASENLNSTNIFTHEGYKGLDSHRSRHREAALEKFRLKRKDRCYEKKVRYQSRKRLAEQRPRVKGQFVRQQPSDPPVSDTRCQ